MIPEHHAKEVGSLLEELRSGTGAVQLAQQPSWCQTTKSAWHGGEANSLLQILPVEPQALEEQGGRQVVPQVEPAGGKKKPKHQLTNQEVTIRIIKASKEKGKQ